MTDKTDKPQTRSSDFRPLELSRLRKGDPIHSPQNTENPQGTNPSRLPWWRWGGLGLPRSAAEIRWYQVLVLVAVGLIVWCELDIKRRGRIVSDAVHLHMTDFTVYTEAGAAFFDGRDPYAVTNPRGWKYLYPPLLALLVAPLAVFDSQSQVCVWFFFCSLLAVGCLWEVAALWRTIRDRRDRPLGAGSSGRDPALWLGLCAFASVLLPMFHDLQRGQVGLLLLYPLLLGIRLVLGPRPGWHGFLGGLILSFPVVIKLHPIVPVGFLVWQRWVALPMLGWKRPRVLSALGVTSGVAVGTVLLLFVIPAAVIGWGANLRSLKTWQQQVVLTRERGSFNGVHEASYHNASFHNASYWLRASLRNEKPRSQYGATARQRRDQASRDTAWAVRGMVVMLLLVAGMALISVDEREGTAAAFGLACSVPLIISPIAWTHYYTILLPGLVFLPYVLLRQSLRVSAVLAAAVPGILLWVHYTALSWAGPVGLLGLGITLWYLAVGIRILLATTSFAARCRVPGPQPAGEGASPSLQVAA
jgi:hypothetical protein